MNDMNAIPLQNVSLLEGFWKSRTEMVARALIPYQWETLNNRTPGAASSNAVENFRIAAGEAAGRFQGNVFQDSDVAKWIEAASYSLVTRPAPGLEEKIDELVRLIEKSQKPDGYVNTYHIVADPEKRWADPAMGHELYCAGHLMEAAVAYYAVTGKTRMLELVCRYADYIGEVFGPDDEQNHSYDGHPEIELALYRLAETTGRERYAKLADHFVNIRGSIDGFSSRRDAGGETDSASRWFGNDYYCAHKPVREMDKAEGHAVRAAYLYSAMADQCRNTGDAELLGALKKIWRNAVSRRMYITAALGSQALGERFTVDYDLPNDTAHAETCASVSLVFWAWRMFFIDPGAEYADIIERAIYNAALAGVSLDGKRYFYVNPLEVNPEIARYRQDHAHVEPRRVPWFSCACCPTNIARLVASIGGYFATLSENAVWVHQYGASEIRTVLKEAEVHIREDTDYPWHGAVRFRVDPSRPATFALHLRIPSWCGRYSVEVNGERRRETRPERGYLRLTRRWEKGDTVELDMDMEVRFVRANDRIRENAGKVAIQRGPLVYCVEECDNGGNLHELLVDPAAPARLERDDRLVPGTVVISIDGYRDRAAVNHDLPYFDYDATGRLTRLRIRAIPYYQWGNRVEDQEMRVWLRVKTG
jgi:DUF1680 family protein